MGSRGEAEGPGDCIRGVAKRVDQGRVHIGPSAADEPGGGERGDDAAGGFADEHGDVSHTVDRLAVGGRYAALAERRKRLVEYIERIASELLSGGRGGENRGAFRLAELRKKQARALLSLCRRKKLKAAVNFQLRHAPCIAAARRLIEAGEIGEVHDMEVRVTVYMPWHLWTFLEGIPRMEILYHSIHYVDLIRSFLGEPRGVCATTVKHPKMMKLASARTNIALDYGDVLRANITTNHGHEFGRRHQESYVKWEATRGAIKSQLGLLLNYPRGEPDALEICRLDAAGKPGPWEPVPFEGTWYPHAFIETMAEVIRFAEGRSSGLSTGVDDAFKTMAVVEAAYESSAHGSTPIPQA
ncbi:MAG: Gfo/Idh/MocA family protein [Opitutaceae bacterium]